MQTNNFPVPKIVSAPDKTLIGMCLSVTLQDMKTVQLWSGFGPRRNEIPDRSDQGNYSVQVYGKEFLTGGFSPTTVFDKWAAVAVNQVEKLPEGMQILEIPAGRWAVFAYKGRAQDFGVFAAQIFRGWLPQSGEQLDDRPHFEYMPPEYLGSNHPDAEEEVWIPIK